MNSREAFEAAWIARQRAAGYGTMLADSEFCQRKPDGTYVSLSLDPAWWAWQAAIQHASDVATAKCAEISEREHRDFKGLNPDAPPGKRGNSYVEGLSDGADLAGDAIKEALK